MSVTLLLADDSITIQRVIELTFADEDVRVVATSDGQQAIQKIDAQPPDIVLADVGMPKVDGYAVALHVKQSPALRHIPVLLLTGAFEPIDEAKARATGCDGVMVKPFEPQVLVTRVRELLAGQRSAELWPAELPRVEPVPAPVKSAVPAAPAKPAVASALPPMPQPAKPAAVAPMPEPAKPAAVVPAPEAPKPVAAAPAPRRPQVVKRELPPPSDAFESELDMLDVALSTVKTGVSPQELDAATASDFARDLEALREEQAPGRPAFGDWDVPAVGASRTSPADDTRPAVELPEAAPIDIVPEELPAEVTAAPPDAAEAPALVEPAQAPAVALPAAPPAPRPSLSNAFSALLAAEQARPTPRAHPVAAPVSDAAIDDVVRRVVARLTEDAVHRVVLDAAERIVREEMSRGTDLRSGH